MKKKYIKPTQYIVVLQHTTQLLSGSVESISDNLDPEDVISITNDDEPVGGDFYGR